MASRYIIKKLEGKVKQAIYGYNLIGNGDSVMVGLSGGKDSYALLDLLVTSRRSLPIKFKLHACHVQASDMTYRADIEFMEQYCAANDVELHIREINVDYNPNDRKPACFICSWKRRKMLFTTARENGCNKLALGHHLDDAIETLLLNMINHSSISSIPPKLSMFKGELFLIRPLTTCLDREMVKYSQLKGFPTEKEQCQYDKDTHRSTVRELIRQMELINRDARENIYRSMQNIFDEYIVTKPKKKNQ
ncbi:tRNA lysidine(34) synthetase [Tenuifilum thalassicum]|uniref:tRNA 2-thiocytidine(32) synthetase TtcA n=1 Tax=Tenuifilum thalassicum TaxID=2590900 RepID=A0A7D3XVE3_9BACT|nr:ATP-binding protein [Tenuifilum thalassicum]QKG79848.1 tRNA 2-thiocytidine(32) synthetase TtcA [Tenuifilum thalassicum]